MISGEKKKIADGFFDYMIADFFRENGSREMTECAPTDRNIF